MTARWRLPPLARKSKRAGDLGNSQAAWRCQYIVIMHMRWVCQSNTPQSGSGEHRYGRLSSSHSTSTRALLNRASSQSLPCKAFCRIITLHGCQCHRRVSSGVPQTLRFLLLLSSSSCLLLHTNGAQPRTHTLNLPLLLAHSCVC